jgi:hypothetical protein
MEVHTISLYWLVPSVSAAAILVGLGIAYGGIKARLTRIEEILYQDHFVTKVEMLARIATVDTAMNAIRDRIRSLEHKEDE